MTSTGVLKTIYATQPFDIKKIIEKHDLEGTREILVVGINLSENLEGVIKTPYQAFSVNTGGKINMHYGLMDFNGLCNAVRDYVERNWEAQKRAITIPALDPLIDEIIMSLY